MFIGYVVHIHRIINFQNYLGAFAVNVFGVLEVSIQSLFAFSFSLSTFLPPSTLPSTIGCLSSTMSFLNDLNVYLNLAAWKTSLVLPITLVVCFFFHRYAIAPLTDELARLPTVRYRWFLPDALNRIAFYFYGRDQIAQGYKKVFHVAAITYPTIRTDAF